MQRFRLERDGHEPIDVGMKFDDEGIWILHRDVAELESTASDLRGELRVGNHLHAKLTDHCRGVENDLTKSQAELSDRYRRIADLEIQVASIRNLNGRLYHESYVHPLQEQFHKSEAELAKSKDATALGRDAYLMAEEWRRKWKDKYRAAEAERDEAKKRTEYLECMREEYGLQRAELYAQHEKLHHPGNKPYVVIKGCWFCVAMVNWTEEKDELSTLRQQLAEAEKRIAQYRASCINEHLCFKYSAEPTTKCKCNAAQSLGEHHKMCPAYGPTGEV